MSVRAGLLFACIALGVALCLPAIPMQRRVVNVIAVVDITQSMNTEDARDGEETVSRLIGVKGILADVVRELPCGSKLGLGVFTAYRSLLLFSPVETCANRRELLDAVAHLSGQMAWAGGSEVAKGLYSALRMAHDLDVRPAIAFFSDGHEAPPINANHRPGMDAVLRGVAGVVVGVGGAAPRPIPKQDPEGRPIGVWQANEVLQTDLWSVGRQGSVDNEAMAPEAPSGPVPRALAGSPGSEHLSYLHEDYLKLLATETQLNYARLGTAQELTAVLEMASMTSPQSVPRDLRWIAGLAALAGLAYSYRGPAGWLRRRVMQPAEYEQRAQA